MRNSIYLYMADDQEVSLVSVGKDKWEIRVGPSEIADEEDSEESLPPALTAEQWCDVAIQLILRVPEAKDPIGLTSTTVDGLKVTGKTLGRKSKWTAEMVGIGSDYHGRVLLELSLPKPLGRLELGAVFKTLIKELSDRAEAERNCL